MNGAAPRERPILFSGEMVRAILAGQKTQTRRVVSSIAGFGQVSEFGPTDNPGYDWHFRDRRGLWNDIRVDNLTCPFGTPGERLWVRETWWCDGNRLFYRADQADDSPWLKAGPCKPPRAWGWRPSIHMPRAASRLLLEVTDVRVERLQDISEEDAVAEGVDGPMCAKLSTSTPWTNHVAPVAVHTYAALWDQINGAGAWGANPWVWAIGFRRLEVANG